MTRKRKAAIATTTALTGVGLYSLFTGQPGKLKVAGDDVWFVMSQDDYATAGRIPIGDFNSDGRVDATDYLTFSNCFNGSNKPQKCSDTRTDFDHDGDVDGNDFLTFSNQMGKMK